jgi:hypothetical protein
LSPIHVATRSFHDVSASPAAEAELTWFLNAAEKAISTPSSYLGLLGRRRASALEEEERRVEALHAAGKIHARLMGLRERDMRTLVGLYTERPWSGAVEAVLPDGLAGAAEQWPSVRAAIALAAYERMRGAGPCVVPAEQA